MNHPTNRAINRTDDDAAVAERPLAHAIALRLLTAKGADAAGLKGYIARTGLADAMVDVLEELTRRVRGLRVEFEDIALTARAATPTAGAVASAEPAGQPPAPQGAGNGAGQGTGQVAGPRKPEPGW